MQKANKKDLLHLGYQIALIIKGFDGILEFLGGIFFISIAPHKIDKFIVKLTQHELSTDPNDRIATAMVDFGHSLSLSTMQFDIIYLTIHGLIKFILVALLWRRKLWAYPICIVAFSLFILYQIYRFSVTHSALVLLLTAFDLVMVYMTYVEYKKALSEMKAVETDSMFN